MLIRARYSSIRFLFLAAPNPKYTNPFLRIRLARGDAVFLCLSIVHWFWDACVSHLAAYLHHCGGIKVFLTHAAAYISSCYTLCV